MIQVQMSKADADIAAQLICEIVKLYQQEKTPFGQARAKAQNINMCLRISGLLYAADEVQE